jgi:hypothetical protein
MRVVFVRPANFALLLLAATLAAFLLSFADAARLRLARATASAAAAALVTQLKLTDPVLFTEARYTRHLSQADLQSAFQDHPVAFEHFPSGSLVIPPAGVIAPYENLDRKAKAPD